MSFRKQLFLSALLVPALLSGSSLFVRAANSDTNVFGFTGPEIFPIDPQVESLHVADIDGDGLNDIIVANNSRSKIDILYNQTGKTNLTHKAKPWSGDVNELPPDARFRIESIASEKRISALVVADLNGDGKPDIAYYGEPKELVVQYNQGTNGWSEPKRFPIDDGQLSENALTTGDLNGDGLTDLVLLADNFVYLIPQKPDHTLGEPQKIPFSGSVKAVQVLDVDGDGLSDLLLVNWEDRNPFRFRLQEKGGELGPEVYFSMPPIRSYWADNLETNNTKTEVITIAQNSGRAAISSFNHKPAEVLSGNLREGQFQVLPLNKTDRARRGLLWADVNGDGLPDLLVAQPDSGQLAIYLQKKDGTLSTAKTFSTLAGVTDLAVGDWDGDGKPDIFMLSEDERQIGVSRLDDKQGLPFPTLIPLDGRPLAMAVGPLKPGTKPVLAVITDQDGKRSLVTRTADGKSKTQKLSEDFKSNPTSISFQDVDQDGLMDLVVLIPYEKVKVLRQVAGKDFEEIDIPAPGGAMEQPWMTSLDVDGDGKPELVLPQKNFLRAVVMQADNSLQSSTNRGGWTFKVKEQINGTASNSRIVGAAAISNGTNNTPSLFMLDGERKQLTLVERDSKGVWQVVRNLDLPVSDFATLQPVALGGANPNTVGFLGLNMAAWMPLHGDVWELTELDSYETPIKDGHLGDVTSGDLNNDGRKDLVFLETAKNYLDLVLFTKDHKLVPANRWQVFEQRTFRGRGSDVPEPREAAVADVTGDGKNDLIVLVHDRILVYPQE